MFCADDFFVLNSPIVFDLMISRFPKFTRTKFPILASQRFIYAWKHAVQSILRALYLVGSDNNLTILGFAVSTWLMRYRNCRLTDSPMELESPFQLRQHKTLCL